MFPAFHRCPTDSEQGGGSERSDREEREAAPGCKTSSRSSRMCPSWVTDRHIDAQTELKS
jgi:hypothetical protein